MSSGDTTLNLSRSLFDNNKMFSQRTLREAFYRKKENIEIKFNDLN